jgi:hypothetical protein
MILVMEALKPSTKDEHKYKEAHERLRDSLPFSRSYEQQIW